MITQDKFNGSSGDKNVRNGKKGFSLIEVLIAISISAFIAFILASFRGNLSLLQNFLNQKLQSRQDADAAMQILQREIRSAGISSNGAYPIESASTSSLVFFSDIDADGLFEQVRYFMGTSTLQKGVIKPSGNPLTYASSSEIITTLVDNAIATSTTPVFRYYDASYTGTQQPMTYPLDVASIRMISFYLSADINASTSPQPELFTFTTDIRNLRSN